MSMVIGLYDDLSTAEEVVSELESSGFGKQDIHLATYDSRAQKRDQGGFFQSLSNLFSGQPKEVDGNSGMLDHLTGWGIPRSDAERYLEAMRRGSTMVLVNGPDNKAQSAKQIMDRFDPVNVDERAGQWQQQGWQGYDKNSEPYTQDQIQRERTQSTNQADMGTNRSRSLNTGEETRLPEMEEELRVGKRAVDRGGVRIHQTVTEKPVEQTATLRDETVNVERRPLDREATEADMNAAFQEQDFEVTETDEELVTDKRARVTGEVVVSKQAEERPETVRDTVRKTEVRTEDLGAGQTTRARDFSSFDNDFRSNYEMAYANRGHDYNYYQPGYRYGYDLANNNQYRGRKWSDVESNARRDWERSHPQSKWDDFKDSIRFAWERATAGGQGNTPDSGWTGTDAESRDRGADARY